MNAHRGITIGLPPGKVRCALIEVNAIYALIAHGITRFRVHRSCPTTTRPPRATQPETLRARGASAGGDDDNACVCTSFAKARTKATKRKRQPDYVCRCFVTHALPFLSFASLALQCHVIFGREGKVDCVRVSCALGHWNSGLIIVVIPRPSRQNNSRVTFP